MEKVCKICSGCKPVTQFPKCKDCKDGFRNECKICTRKRKVIYESTNPEKYKEYQDKFLKENPVYFKKYNEEYSSLDYVKARKRNWYENNLDYYRNLEKTPERKEYRYLYNKGSMEFKWRQFLCSTLKRLGKKKEGKTITILGYTALDLKNHITSLFTEGMSWDNYGEWHIDHIFPLSKFPKNTPVHVVNTLNNLQPLWAVTKEINGNIYLGNLNKSNNIFN